MVRYRVVKLGWQQTGHENYGVVAYTATGRTGRFHVRGTYLDRAAAVEAAKGYRTTPPLEKNLIPFSFWSYPPPYLPPYPGPEPLGR